MNSRFVISNHKHFYLSNWKDEIASNSDAGDYERDRYKGEN